MIKKIAFAVLCLLVFLGTYVTLSNLPKLQNEFVSKPFFSAFYNNIGLVLFGPATLIIGAIIIAVLIWIKLGKRDKDS